jgi:hypothetical protein
MFDEQEVAEMIEVGDLIPAGTKHGEAQYTSSLKIVIKTALAGVAETLQQADEERRDLTREECRQILPYFAKTADSIKRHC